MADDSAQVKFGGDIGDLTSSMQAMQSTVASALDSMKAALQTLTDQSKQNSDAIVDSNKKIQDSVTGLKETFEKSFAGMTGIMSTFRTGFAALAGILAGGEMFKASIDATIKWDTEVAKLSRSLGITMGSASELNVALRLIGTDSDTYIGSLQKLERQLRTNESGLNELGMVTRDSNKQLVDGETAMSNALTTIKQYKAGLDQGIVGQQFFGRSAEAIAPLLRLNNEIMDRAKTLADELGLKIGKDNVAAMRAYQVELNAFKLLWTSVEIKIGNEVMKTLTQLANYLNTDGRAAVNNFADMVKYLVGVLDLAISTARAFGVMWAYLKSLPMAVSDIVTKVGEHGPGEVLSGNIKTLGDEIEDKYGKMLDGIDKGFQARWNALWANLKPPNLRAGPSKSDWSEFDMSTPKTAPNGGDDGSKDGKGGASSIVSTWQTELEDLKRLQENWNTWSLEREAQYWMEKEKLTEKGSDESKEVWRKLQDVYRQMNDQQKAALEKQVKDEEAIQKIRTNAAVLHEQAMYDMQISSIKARVQAGLLTEEEGLRLEKQLLDQRYNAQVADLQRRLELMKKDPQADPAKIAEIYAQIGKVTDKYWKDEQNIQNQALIKSAQEWKTAFNQIGSSVAGAIKGMIMQTETLQQAMTSVAEAILGAFLDMLTKWVAQWVWSHTFAKLFASATGTAEVASSAGVGAAAAGAGVAYEAALTDNLELIPATMAAAYGMIMGMSPATASAAGGWWEVPGTVTSILHPQEMVLPAGPAQGLRDMLSGGGAGGGGELHVHIYANDAKSFEAQLKRSNSALNLQLQKSIRDFRLRPTRR